MADRWKLGLCYNCDESYVRGHMCPHLFYLEVSNYVVEELEDVTRRVGLHLQPCLGAGVIMANGDRVACHSLAHDVGICIMDEIFHINCYSNPIDSYYMVISDTFLHMLGLILWDFDDLCMVF